MQLFSFVSINLGWWPLWKYNIAVHCCTDFCTRQCGCLTSTDSPFVLSEDRHIVVTLSPDKTSLFLCLDGVGCCLVGGGGGGAEGEKRKGGGGEIKSLSAIVLLSNNIDLCVVNRHVHCQCDGTSRRRQKQFHCRVSCILSFTSFC